MHSKKNESWEIRIFLDDQIIQSLPGYTSKQEAENAIKRNMVIIPGGYTHQIGKNTFEVPDGPVRYSVDLYFKGTPVPDVNSNNLIQYLFGSDIKYWDRGSDSSQKYRVTVEEVDEK